MRLKAMAQVRAQTIAARIRPKIFQPGQPRLSRAATNIAASANGSAKTVCEKRTNPPHFRSEDRGLKMDDGVLSAVMCGNSSGPFAIFHLRFTRALPTSAKQVFVAGPDDPAHAQPRCPPRPESFWGRCKT